MKPPRKYASATAFRVALEGRLKRLAQEESLDLQRVRRQVAQQTAGAEVEVTLLEARANDLPFLGAILKLAKPRDWPEDFALNHAYYAKGHPRES